MELSPSNSVFNQSGIYQLHPTRQGEARGSIDSAEVLITALYLVQ